MLPQCIFAARCVTKDKIAFKWVYERLQCAMVLFFNVCDYLFFPFFFGGVVGVVREVFIFDVDFIIFVSP